MFCNNPKYTCSDSIQLSKVLCYDKCYCRVRMIMSTINAPNSWSDPSVCYIGHTGIAIITTLK